MATAPQKTKEAPAEEGAPKKKSKKKLLIILISVITLVALGIGAFFYFSADSGKQEIKKVEAKPPVFVTMEALTLNLQKDEDEVERFLQVGITAQVPDQESADMMKLYMPQIRSRLLMMMSTKKASDLGNEDGKKKLVADILAQIRLPYGPNGPNQKITNIFFTSFVIQ